MLFNLSADACGIGTFCTDGFPEAENSAMQHIRDCAILDLHKLVCPKKLEVFMATRTIFFFFFFYPYFREPLFSKAMKLLSVMDEISKERNVPLAQIALNWTLKKEFISSCITGSQSRDKIEANSKVFDWELSAEEMQMLDKAIEEYSRE